MCYLTADAIAEYEKSAELNRFTSKYDFYLKGEVELTEQEKSGLILFEEETKGNCAACHAPVAAIEGIATPIDTPETITGTFTADLNELAETIVWADDSLGTEPFRVVLPYLSKKIGKICYAESTQPAICPATRRTAGTNRR